MISIFLLQEYYKVFTQYFPRKLENIKWQFLIFATMLCHKSLLKVNMFILYILTLWVNVPLSLVQNTWEGSWRRQKVDKQSRRRFKQALIQIHIIAQLYQVKFLNSYVNLSSFFAENEFPVYVLKKRQITVFTKSRTLCWEFEQKGHIKFGLNHVATKNNAIFRTTYCNQL